MIKIIKTKKGGESTNIDIIGHRVVHGGEKITKAQKVNEKTIKTIKEYTQFAPLHNPANKI